MFILPDQAKRRRLAILLWAPGFFATTRSTLGFLPMTPPFCPIARASDVVMGYKCGMTIRSVAIVVLEGVQALDVAGPLDVLTEANGFLAVDDRYAISLVGHSDRPIRASNGMQMIADRTFDDDEGVFSLVLVAGGPNLPDALPDPRVTAWLRRHCSGAELYGSICTGAFVVGHAGLLDGRDVTTHWQNAAHLAATFPAARVNHDRIFLKDGPLVTSAGVTAGIDLALSIVAQDHGSQVARSIAKRLVVLAQRQGGQSQFSPFLATARDEVSPPAKVQAYVLAHIGEMLDVERLAAIGGISARSLARLFANETGMTPHAFVEAARLDIARNMLEGTTLQLKTIAYDCGFGTAEHMRTVFSRRLGVSPAQYRASFQG
jgi:transcriptional regulator GlxA family with amidase domain